MRRKITYLTLFVFAIGPTILHADEPGSVLPANRPIPEVIDHYIDAKISAMEVQPAPLADDATFLRRLTLDLVGRIPTKAELEAYVSSKNANKKAEVVDRLLASAEFARNQGERFATMMTVDGRNKDPLQDYLQTSFAENRPWDDLFRELILPDQTDKEQVKASDFLKSRIRDLNKTTVDVSTLFFGVNISCAQCHDHPHVPSWTQDHFYGMKSFFSRTFDNGGFLAEKSYGAVKFTPNKGKPKVAPVMFLTGKTITPPGMESPDKNQQKKERDLFNKAKKQKQPAPTPRYSLREKLIGIALGSEGERFFSRSIVNRIWYQYFGCGLVMPLDQMHSENLPSHPELLHWLARDMASHDYDLQRLIRGIVLSDAYARSSRQVAEFAPADNMFAVAQVRALPPMSLARSLFLASTDPESLPTKETDLEKYFDNLDRRARGLASLFPEPGSKFQVSVEEAMLFSNNERIQRDLFQRGDSLVSRLIIIEDLKERAHYAVRTVLSRPARPEEIGALTRYMQEREARSEEACRQVVWALLTSSEFRFNH